MLRQPLRFSLRAATARTALAALVIASGASGCDAVLGIHDVETDPTGGGGAGGTPTTTTMTGGGGAGGAPAGGGGTGGTTTTAGDFTFAVTTAKVVLPLAGRAFVDVQIVPDDGFSGAVDIGLVTPPNGVVFEGTTLAAGTTAGKVKVGVTAGTFQIGDEVALTFQATSGDIEREVAVNATVTGAPGTLVEEFGAAGVASWNGAMDGTNVFDVREVALGKIVATGDHTPGLSSHMKGARVLPSGAMDIAFGGTDGTVTANFCGCTKPSEGRTVLREIGGRVLMIGTGNGGSGFTDDIAIARFKDDGKPDVVNSDGGKTLIDLGGVEKVAKAALAPDGKIVVVGTRGADVFVARLGAEFFNLDTTFHAPDGYLVFPAGMSVAVDVAVDSAGNVVVAGRDSGDVVLARVLANGQPDPAFGGGDGVAILGSNDRRARAMALDAQGRVFVAGDMLGSGAGDPFVMRILPDGTPDPAYGTGGMTVLPNPVAQEVADMVLLPDGRAVLGGWAGASGFLARFLPDGTPDETFGTDGYTTINLGASSRLQSMAPSMDGRIFAAGYRETQPTKGFIAKIWN